MKMENHQCNALTLKIVQNEDLLQYSSLVENWDFFALHLGFDLDQIKALADAFSPNYVFFFRFAMLHKWFDMVLKYDQNPRWLLVPTFSKIHDNRAAVEILGNREALVHVKALKLNSTLLKEIQQITFQ